MTLQERIDQMVDAKVEAAIAAMLGGDATPATNGNGRTRPMPLMRRADDSSDVDQPRRGRKRGPGRAQVTYTLLKTRGRQKTITAEDLYPTAWVTYKAVRDAKGPITKAEIEAKTKQNGKTIESNIYFLRHRKLIQSNRIDRSGDE